MPLKHCRKAFCVLCIELERTSQASFSTRHLSMLVLSLIPGLQVVTVTTIVTAIATAIVTVTGTATEIAAVTTTPGTTIATTTTMIAMTTIAMTTVTRTTELGAGAPAETTTAEIGGWWERAACARVKC